jgi:iron complex outermembrane receptor protein
MSVYGQIEFDLSDTVELALAGRYDREKRSVSNRVPAIANSGLNLNLQNPPFSGTPGLLNAALAGGELPTRRESFTQFQPKATLSWAASDAVNAYASYGVGFRSGGFNSVGTSATLNFWFNSDFVVDPVNGLPVAAGLQIEDEYDKEVSTSVEAGIKADLMDGRLRVNAAVFKTDVEDNQFFEFFAGPFGLLRTVTTIDDLTISGFEADATYLATENLSLYGGIGLLDSEIERNNNRPLSVGNDVPQAPDMTANIGAQWISPMRDGMELVARVDYQYVGETFFHTLQDEQVPNIWRSFGFGPTMSDFSKSSRDAYGTLDARIGIESASWSVTLWGRNLTDEQYLQEIIPAPEFGGSFNHPSALRSYGLEATYRF